MLGRNEGPKAKGLNRAVTAEGVATPITITETDFTFPGVVVDKNGRINRENERPENTRNIPKLTICGNGDACEWFIDIGASTNFIFEKKGGHAVEGSKEQLAIKFLPKMPGEYEEFAVVRFKEDDTWHKLKRICLRGKGVKPSMSVSTRRIIFTPIPPGFVVRTHMTIYYNGFSRLTLSDPIIGDPSLPLSASIVSGNSFVSRTSRVQIEVVFAPTSVCSLVTSISFATTAQKENDLDHDDESVQRSIDVSAMCSNSILSLVQLFPIDLSHEIENDPHLTERSKDSRASWDESARSAPALTSRMDSSRAHGIETDRDVSGNRRCAMANLVIRKHLSVLQLYHTMNQRSVDEESFSFTQPEVVALALTLFQWLIPVSERNSILDSASKFIFSIFDARRKNRGTERALRVENSIYHTNPYELLVKRGREILIVFLDALGLPIKEQAPENTNAPKIPEKEKETIKTGIKSESESFEEEVKFMDEVLRVLTANGFALGHIRPEYLISYEKYMVLASEKSYVTSPGLWNSSIGRNAHNMLSSEAWTCLLLSVVNNTILRSASEHPFALRGVHRSVDKWKAYRESFLSTHNRYDFGLLKWAQTNARGLMEGELDVSSTLPKNGSQKRRFMFDSYFVSKEQFQDVIRGLQTLLRMANDTARPDKAEKLDASTVLSRLGVPSNSSGSSRFSASEAQLLTFAENSVTSPPSLLLLLLLCYLTARDMDAVFRLRSVAVEPGKSTEEQFTIYNSSNEEMIYRLKIGERWGSRTPLLSDLCDANALKRAAQAEWSVSQNVVAVKPYSSAEITIAYEPSGFLLSSTAIVSVGHMDMHGRDSVVLHVTGKLLESPPVEITQTIRLFERQITMVGIRNPFKRAAVFQATVLQFTEPEGKEDQIIPTEEISTRLKPEDLFNQSSGPSRLQETTISMDSGEERNVPLELLLVNPPQGHTTEKQGKSSKQSQRERKKRGKDKRPEESKPDLKRRRQS